MVDYYGVLSPLCIHLGRIPDLDADASAITTGVPGAVASSSGDGAQLESFSSSASFKCLVEILQSPEIFVGPMQN